MTGGLNGKRGVAVGSRVGRVGFGMGTLDERLSEKRYLIL